LEGSLRNGSSGQQLNGFHLMVIQRVEAAKFVSDHPEYERIQPWRSFS
jgi:hypothetical protein